MPLTALHCETPADEPATGKLRALHRLRKCAGVLLVEVLVAAGVLALVVVGGGQALLTANRLAAASRVWTGARAVVQRNIDTALTATFTQASVPSILAITGANGSTWDDDGGFDNTVQIAVQDNNSLIVAAGTLTRTVVSVSNSDNADIRRVTFTLTYTYRGRANTISMSTMRSIDD